MHVKHDSFILSFSTTSLRACATSRSMNQSTWMLKCLNLSCSLNQMFVQEAQRVCVLFCIFYEVYRCKYGAFFFFQDSEKHSTHTRTCLRCYKIIFDFEAVDSSALQIKVILSDRG